MLAVFFNISSVFHQIITLIDNFMFDLNNMKSSKIQHGILFTTKNDLKLNFDNGQTVARGGIISSSFSPLLTWLEVAVL
jgi:hypothetical protein